jgi:hypothetical protein
MTNFTILQQSSEAPVQASLEADAIRVRADDIAAALGWELKPEGFCLGPVCYPVPEGSDLVTDDGVDLAGLAALLGRPLAVDQAHNAAFLGTAATERADSISSLHAPNFTLPDLDGAPHTLSGHRGSKVLLVAYASW